MPNDEANDEKRKEQWRLASRRHYLKKKAEKLHEHSEMTNRKGDEAEDENLHTNTIPRENNIFDEDPQQFSQQKPQQFSSSSPGIVFSPEDIMTARHGMTKQQQRIFDGVISLATQRMRQNQVVRNDGHGNIGYYGQNEVDQALAEAIRAKTRERTMKWLFSDEQPKSNPNDSLKEEMRLFNFLKGFWEFMAKAQPGPSDVDQMVKAYMVHLLKEKIEGTDSTMPKLSWDQWKELQGMKEARTERRERNKLIRDIAIPAIEKAGPLIESLTNAGRRKVDRIGQPMGVLCPNCQAQGRETVIRVVGTPNEIVCPSCGVVLRKNVENVEPKTSEVGSSEVSQEKIADMANVFLCPKCAEKGIETPIDVSNEPDVAKCKTCGAEFPKAPQETPKEHKPAEQEVLHPPKKSTKKKRITKEVE